ncbi:MAG: c-type cytochrome [Gemmataceae bacterium]|nr:c-type cytochrome [Gemmataceae bacterium]
MKRTTALFLAVAVPLAFLVSSDTVVTAQKNEVIPHGQDAPPGPPLSPAEAIRKMTVPEGFTVELVAAEPDIVNPVGMTFDERGRVWITESLEYPRHSAGPGKDRVKVLESTKGDGIYDKVTIFAEGLNIPSGIAVGHGGVWVANAPDILFYKEGPDGKAAGKPEVVVTGFGRSDTHELPNSLTWGPDGWLYGLNGVFNPSVVKSNNGKEYRFTVALFRIHPKTREFQLFCEGTSNPWGVAWDNDGSAFISACVIDHLWHLVETGYYHRQGGPYPPHTWKLGSIVKHKHQRAAYCGITFFDSDAYPAEYREKLYMGNIHGGCINCDEVTRDGSTYFGKGRPDFLTANDKWFMPVVQKTGPDGCLYVLDWYDRYHCYQDANRDPKGIDRDRGRLYRVRYKDTPRAGKFDLAKESDDDLIKRLHSPNVYFRDIAQRILTERDSAQGRDMLEKLVLNDSAPRKARMHALWSLVGTGKLDAVFSKRLLAHRDPAFRAWAVRAAGNARNVDPGIRNAIVALAQDPSPDVKLQVAIAACKLDGVEPMPVLLQVLARCGDDKVIPAIVWQNLHPLLEDKSGHFIRVVEKTDLKASPNLAGLLPRVIERMIGSKKPDPHALCQLLALLIEGKNGHHECCCQCMATLAGKVQTGEVAGDHHAVIKNKLLPVVQRVLVEKPDHPLYLDAALLAATLKEPAGVEAVRKVFAAKEQTEAARLKALAALITAGDATLMDGVTVILTDAKGNTVAFRGQVLAALGKLEQPKVAEVVLDLYPKMESDLQPKAIELLTQRVPWSKLLLQRIAKKEISSGTLNVNQVKKLLAFKDMELTKQVTAVWGNLRDERNPEREKVVIEMRNYLRKTPGDPKAGQLVFKNVCAQCHKIYGEGQEVGPDVTANGRSDFEQLLSNVFDPSLVIGAGYLATTVATKKGQVLTGIVVEDNAQRVVLKVQGGKLETIARGDIDEMAVSKVSLMPEGLEKQLKPQEIADLFAFLCLDKPPTDPSAKRIPGSPNPK